MASVKKAIILVAGYGTRFLPITKAIPKEMLPIVDTPQVQFLVEEVVASGIREIVFVTSRAKQSLENYFDDSPELVAYLRRKKKPGLVRDIQRISRLAKFAYIRQPRPVGHGDAVLRAAEFFAKQEPVAVLFGDDIVVDKTPVLRQMLDVFKRYQDPVLALCRVPKDRVHLYGVVRAQEAGSKSDFVLRLRQKSKSDFVLRLRQKSDFYKPHSPRVYQIQYFVEKPSAAKAPSDLAVIGKYILTPQFFSVLKKIKHSSSSELGVGDGFNPYLKTNPLYGVEVAGVWHDVGSKLGFLQAQVEFGLTHPEVGKEFAKWLASRKTPMSLPTGDLPKGDKPQ